MVSISDKVIQMHKELLNVGFEVGKYATGSYNTFVGSEAGRGGTTSIRIVQVHRICYRIPSS